MNTSERRKNYTPEQIEAERAYAKRYREENKDLLAKRMRDRRAKGHYKNTSYYRQRQTPEQREAELAYKRERYRTNRDSALAYAAEYREKNKDRLRAEWRHQNEERKDYFRDWLSKNADRCKLVRQAWKDANRERIAAVQAAYLQKNLDQHRAHQHNRRAKKRANGGRLSPHIAEKLLVLQKGRCACCGLRLSGDYELDHIVPLALDGPNTDENMQLLHARCNRQKGAKDPVAFMQMKGMLL